MDLVERVHHHRRRIHHISNLVQLPLPFFFHPLCLHDLPHRLDTKNLLQLACLPHPALIVTRTLHRAKKFFLRHLREKPLLHLDVLRKIRHVLRKWRIKLTALRGHSRGLPANHPTASPIVQGWAHPTLLLHELIVKRSFASFSLHLHQTNLLLPFELLELELFLQFHQLLSLLSFALFLELEKLSLLLLPPVACAPEAEPVLVPEGAAVALRGSGFELLSFVSI